MCAMMRMLTRRPVLPSPFRLPRAPSHRCHPATTPTREGVAACRRDPRKLAVACLLRLAARNAPPPSPLSLIVPPSLRYSICVDVGGVEVAVRAFRRRHADGSASCGLGHFVVGALMVCGFRVGVLVFMGKGVGFVGGGILSLMFWEGGREGVFGVDQDVLLGSEV